MGGRAAGRFPRRNLGIRGSAWRGRRGQRPGGLCVSVRGKGSSRGWGPRAGREAAAARNSQAGAPGWGGGRAERGGSAGSPHPELLLPHLPTALAQLAQPPAGAGDAADVGGRQRAATQDVLQHLSGQVDQAAEARRLGHGLLHQRRHHLHRAVDRCRRHLVRVPGAPRARARVCSRQGAPLAPPTRLEGRGPRSPCPAPHAPPKPVATAPLGPAHSPRGAGAGVPPLPLRSGPWPHPPQLLSPSWPRPPTSRGGRWGPPSPTTAQARGHTPSAPAAPGGLRPWPREGNASWKITPLWAWEL